MLPIFYWDVDPFAWNGVGRVPLVDILVGNGCSLGAFALGLTLALELLECIAFSIAFATSLALAIGWFGLEGFALALALILQLGCNQVVRISTKAHHSIRRVELIAHPAVPSSEH